MKIDVTKILKENLSSPALRYLFMLYLVTFFAQILKFDELGILPSKGNYSFLLILNYMKEISQLLILIIGSTVIWLSLINFFGVFTFSKCIDLLRIGILIYYLKSYQEATIYKENFYIIFLCWLIMFFVEVFHYKECEDKLENKYRERIFYNRIIIYGIVIAKGIVYVQSTIKI
ncbi:hypothetical protein [Fusobacterium sp.]|uniref:hypothetical protein n=1 Tax=Fusobacterium sp. TaxID=68766 RepID=UPI0028FF0425|nr:hypothetical protein [Fusobacterium sp.]MDU1912592.1 hypothetical protein [Fusobacterium sp.]